MSDLLLSIAAALQSLAVVYALYLFRRRRGAASAWLWLLGAMLSMLTWRIVVVMEVVPPPYFNPLIAIWGSTCMVAAMFLFGREVAGRERAEAERDALLESERAARIEAERSSRVKDDFLATLSHELRTPLAAILGWCHVLKAQSSANTAGTPVELERALATIERNAQAQARLVDELLDITRIQGGVLHLETAPVGLDRLARAAVDSVRPAANAKSIRLELHDSATSARVTGDAGRLQQVIINLLVNAVKFTPAGGTIDVRVSQDESHAHLVVRDDGQGIEPELLPRLFERFRQGDQTIARRHGGLGLGLSIVDSLVRLHGGEVSAQSEGPGRGSTFTVTLPLAADGDESALEAAPMAEAAGLRVLLVDDDSDLRLVVTRILEQAGMKVCALDSGAQVASAARAFDPHVLVSDIGMPGEDGYSLLRRLEREAGWRERGIVAIALTAHGRGEDRDRALASGFVAHLAKPVDAAELIAAVRRAAARSAS